MVGVSALSAAPLCHGKVEVDATDLLHWMLLCLQVCWEAVQFYVTRCMNPDNRRVRSVNPVPSHLVRKLVQDTLPFLRIGRVRVYGLEFRGKGLGLRVWI